MASPGANEPLVVYFSPWSYWERENRSQPLARALAELGHQVLYVNYPLGRRIGSRFKRLLVRRTHQLEQPGLHLSVGGPFWRTYHWPDMIYVPPKGPSPRQKAYVDFLLRLVQEEPFRGRELVVLSSRMISQPFVRRARPRMYALDLEDPWSHFHEVWRVSREELLAALRGFCGEAQVVFANGRKIAEGAQENFLEQEPRILLNGVDPDKFHPDPTVPRPADYPPGPSVLYSGMLNERIDFELLEKVFPALRRVNFVFLGGMFSHFVPTTRQLAERHPNVHFLGHRPVEELSAYLQRADLFMIPSCQDEAWTRAFPAKVFEYFMFGKQTVSTFPLDDIPEQYRFAVRVATDAESFVRQVEKGLQGDSRGEEIAAYGRQQTWSSRAEQVARALGLVA